MVNKEIINWGIIGCGDVTERKSGPAYNKAEGFKLQAVMRRDAAKAEDYAKRHGVPKFYTDAGALINDTEIDAVYIATPPDTHAHYALMVAAAGKPCCIEKPMAPSYAECLEIVQAFEQKNLPLFVAYYRRSLPRFSKIKEWLDAGKIGEVREVRWHLARTASPVDRSGEYNWRTDAGIAPAGYFDDLASHGLDLFMHYFGPVSEAKGISLNQQGLYSAKDAIAAAWLHKSGIMGSGSWNFGQSEKDDRVEIFGSRGKIEFSVFDEQPLILTNADGKEHMIIAHPENIQLYHVQNMKEHLAGNMLHPSTGATGAHTAWVMDKILGSI